MLSNDGNESVQYPKLKATDHNVRSSCQFAEIADKTAQLETNVSTLKMPPVSSAVAKRQRKLHQNEEGGFRSFNQSNNGNNGAAPSKTSSMNIHESQKRIRAIIDKSGERTLTQGHPAPAATVGEIDAIGSYSLNKVPATHRDLKSFDEKNSMKVVSSILQQEEMPTSMLQTQKQQQTL